MFEHYGHTTAPRSQRNASWGQPPRPAHLWTKTGPNTGRDLYRPRPRTAGSAIAGAMQVAPAHLRAELTDEASVIDDMMNETQYGEITRASKFLSADVSRKSRTRGRGDRR